MKTIIYSLCLCFALLSCKSENHSDNKNVNSIDTKVSENNPSLIGAWELIGFYNYKNNKIIDSFTTSPEYRQVKMYTASKVMWSKSVPKDSTEWFGFGSYNINKDSLTEVLDYGSKIMSQIIDEKKEFVYEIDLTDDSFIQIEIDEEGNRIYSENYKRIE